MLKGCLDALIPKYFFCDEFELRTRSD